MAAAGAGGGGGDRGAVGDDGATRVGRRLQTVQRGLRGAAGPSHLPLVSLDQLTVGLPQFEIPAQGETGHITDPSGRCLSVLDCALPAHQPALTAAGMGVAVLDECGAGPCGGANQQWTHTPKEAGVFELLTTLTPAAAAAATLQNGERAPEVEGWRLMGTFDPGIVNDERNAPPRPQPAARRP